MAKTIWRISLDKLAKTKEIEVDAPEGSVVLCFRAHTDHPTIWVRCDPEAPNVGLGQIALVPTGKDATLYDGDAGWQYIGSDSFYDDKVILHAFWKYRVAP